MHERIVLASGLNGTELLRSLALRGKKNMGLRIVSSTELAKTALMKSGISITESFLSGKDEAGQQKPRRRFAPDVPLDVEGHPDHHRQAGRPSAQHADAAVHDA